MSAEEKVINEIVQGLKELREEVEKLPADQNKDKIDAINKSLDGLEEHNQKIVLENSERDKKDLETAERMDLLEKEVARKSNEKGRKGDYKDTQEFKAFNYIVRNGEGSAPIEDVIAFRKGYNFTGDEKDWEKKVLRTDIDPSGGFLVPEVLDNILVKKIIEVSPIRGAVRVRRINDKSLQIPIRNDIPTATFEGEAETGSDSQSDYQAVTFTPFRQTNTVPVTFDLIQDALFNIESEIIEDSALAFAKSEGREFVLGNSPKTPQGFVANAEIQANARAGESASSVTGDDLLLLTGDLKFGYNPMFAFNRRTLAVIRTTKSTGSGVYQFEPALNGGVANMIAGFPYIIAEDMPDIASDAFSVAFADFFRGYTIVDGAGLRMIRDDLTKKRDAIVEFTMQRWVTGGVVLPEAFKLLQNAS